MRLDGIGDALICTPLIAALRAAGHEVGIALSDRNRDVFAPRTFCAIHVLERIPWPAHGSTPASAARAKAEIAAARYDAALVVSEEPQAYGLARGIARRMGFTTGLAKPLKSLWARVQLTRSVRRSADLRRPGRHEVEIVYGLGRRAGLVDGAPPRDPALLRTLVLGDDAAPAAGAGPVVVQLGLKWRAIGLDHASAATVVGRLAERGAQLIASPAEREAAAELAGGAPVFVCADTASWKAALARARLVVTPDTGAAHVAGMLGVPVVDVFAESRAAAQIARWHPWAAPYVALTAAELRGSGGAARIERALDAL